MDRIRVWIYRPSDRAALQLQWVDPVTRRKRTKSTGSTNEGEAEAKRVDLESDLNAGRHHDVSRLTWAAFRERFEAEYVSALRLGTRRLYGDTFRLFERLARPGTLRAVNERCLSGFVASCRTYRTRGREGLAASTIRLRLEHLHTALTWARQQKLISEIPGFPGIRVSHRRPQKIGAELVERLIARAPDLQTRAYLACGWYAGLRLNEAFALEWEPTDSAPWVDLAGERIVFPAKFAKSNEDQEVALAPELRTLLLALPRDGARVFRFLAVDGHEISANALSGRIVRLAKRAGVRLTMHSLRKAFGCHYAAMVPAQVLQEMMRHKSITITLDYYVSCRDAAREAILGNNPGNTAAEVPGNCGKITPL